MTSGLSIIVEKKGPVAILRIEGRMDAASSPVLEVQLTNLIQQNFKNFLLDFSKVEYLSSAGMRLLLSMTKKLKASGSKLFFCSINDEVMEIIRMASFEKILSIYKTEKEALESI